MNEGKCATAPDGFIRGWARGLLRRAPILVGKLDIDADRRIHIRCGQAHAYHSGFDVGLRKFHSGTYRKAMLLELLRAGESAQ